MMSSPKDFERERTKYRLIIRLPTLGDGTENARGPSRHDGIYIDVQITYAPSDIQVKLVKARSRLFIYGRTAGPADSKTNEAVHLSL